MGHELAHPDPPPPSPGWGCGAGSRGFPGCGCCRPAEVSLLDLGNFGLCASSAAPGQSPPTPASRAAWLQLCGRRHATVTVTVSCSPPLRAAPHCLPWFQGGLSLVLGGGRPAPLGGDLVWAPFCGFPKPPKDSQSQTGLGKPQASGKGVPSPARLVWA